MEKHIKKKLKRQIGYGWESPAFMHGEDVKKEC